MQLGEITVTAPCPDCGTDTVLHHLTSTDTPLLALEGICPGAGCALAFCARIHRPDPRRFAPISSGHTAWGWATIRRHDDGTFAFEPATTDGGFALAWTLD